MKELGLLTALVVMSFIGFSQTLKPKIIIEGKDTSFSFNIQDSKFLAKTIVGNRYCDSIQDVNAQLVTIQDSIIKAQKSLIGTIQLINVNNNGQITGLNILNSTLKLDLNKAQALNARLKRHRWIYFGAGVLTSATAVYLLK